MHLLVVFDETVYLIEFLGIDMLYRTCTILFLYFLSEKVMQIADDRKLLFQAVCINPIPPSPLTMPTFVDRFPSTLSLC